MGISVLVIANGYWQYIWSIYNFILTTHKNCNKILKLISTLIEHALYFNFHKFSYFLFNQALRVWVSLFIRFSTGHSGTQKG